MFVVVGCSRIFKLLCQSENTIYSLKPNNSKYKIKNNLIFFSRKHFAIFTFFFSLKKKNTDLFHSTVFILALVRSLVRTCVVVSNKAKNY